MTHVNGLISCGALLTGSDTIMVRVRFVSGQCNRYPAIAVVFGVCITIKTRFPLLYSSVGEVAEWLQAPLSKSGVRQRTAGSNPALSATHPSFAPGGCQFFDLLWCPGTHAERCESGLIGTPGKRVCRQRYRGFESRPLRQKMIMGELAELVEGA